ncbi:LamG-like jellyroll fold domain-containing protein [Flavobacterium sp. LT1R49]|uniref:LamG-like jellyroll fold domain-containing protein n=1 Tax=Flavobacterium arabinosi TaxID=3398737 RepID=UPI003A878479
MKKLIITMVFGLMAAGLWAQNDDGAKVVPVSQAIQKNGFTIQVGIPYLGQHLISNVKDTLRTTHPADIRFPWGILYLFNTFAEESFDVSKGYFGDKILISWDLRSNFELISSIKIYKRVYDAAGGKPYQFVGSVSPSVTQYEDKYAEGGVLFQYKVVAEGVSKIESLYTTYITGFGYRNPTAVVTGNINYKGGNPVQDVIVMASTAGNSSNPGSSLSIPALSSLIIGNQNIPITTALTYQAWVKPKNAYTTDNENAIKLLRLSIGKDTIKDIINVSVNLLVSSKTLAINIGNSIFKLKNYFPSGKLNSRGDDILVPVTDFNTNFVHFSVVINDAMVPVLFINGRPITAAYKESVNKKLIGLDSNYTSPYFDVIIPTQPNTLNIGGNNTQWTTLAVGGGNDSFIDEIRIWKAGLEPKTIRTDYTRYISGNDSRLVSYIRANEKVGLYAYDLSRNGFNYNKNHGIFESSKDTVTWASGSGNFPTGDQLGILGVTDVNGNYEITSIPYSGTGESFTITPMYGQHKFEPNQQLVFLGQGSEVVNKIDFIDKSAFSFKGKVQFDSRDVFPSYVKVDTKLPGNEGTSWIKGPGILDEGYNYYEKSGEKFSKGKYWLNDMRTPSDKSDDYLDIYASIFTQGANVYIDGNMVLDVNNLPVVTDDLGFFDISVPIGNHYVSVKKDGHIFTYNGRFPENSFKEFFEDSNEPVVFIDKTKVTVVGKVVGGAVESAKKIGFGENGLLTKTVKDANGNTVTLEISAKNNIGKANFTLGYAPVGATVTPYTKSSFSTNPNSGEYRVSLLPLQYELKAENLTIGTASTISLLKAGSTETLDFSKVVAQTTPEFSYTDGTLDKKEIGLPYHYEKSFTYRSNPVLQVVEQSCDKTISIKGVAITTTDFAHPVYTQFNPYKIVLNRFERYTNMDTGTAVEVKVPVNDGELIKNNNLALLNSESVVVDPNDESRLTYNFKGGLPSVSPPFTITSSLKYRINEVDYDVEGYNATGIVLGGKSDGSRTFVTAAPDMPDIILRDPPGSNSSASIEKGESISFTTESSLAHSEGLTTDFTLLGGVKFAAGGGLAGPVIESQATNSLHLGIGVKSTSTDGKSLTKTYTFNQTISTSDDPAYVGSNADLYIGNSKNQFYGSFDDVKASTSIPKKTIAGIQVVLDSSEYINLGSPTTPLYISKQKSVYFVDEPSSTFFIYSQKHILETLIPEYEIFITNIDNGSLIPGKGGALTKVQYQERIRLWRKLILVNEKNKYFAKNNRIEYKAIVTHVLAEFNNAINKAITTGDTGPVALTNLKSKLAESKKTSDLLDKYFQKNISFDSGLGEYSQSVETSVVAASSLAYNVTVDENFGFDVGFKLNEMGVLNSTRGVFQQDLNSSLSEESTNTTTVSYTLKDNDPANFLSVDVVNAFDGNGPIFITQGGRTSCPHEEAEKSHFYNHVDYSATATSINELADDKREELSFATQKVEVPVLRVTDANMSNITESKNAEFELKLENNSAAGVDADFKLVIDNTTNPDNALINIEPNGTVVHVPYGQTVLYKMTLGKSISDVYEYKDIKVRLESLCDGEDVSSSVLVSAHFVPSCSQVIVSAPLNNWVYNMETAYNTNGSTNPLLINMIGYSTKFKSFKKIDLEYRLATTPNWTRLQTYYGTQAFYDAAVLNNESQISFIGSKTTLSYPIDIAALKLLDGNYQIRARSTCTNDTEYISDVITGRVDLNSPQRFGTPLPIDGILGAGEDLKVSFNEPVFYNSAVSTIEIKGQTNQLPIDHKVSLHFEGAANTAVINNPKITSGDLTFEFWMNNSTTASTAVILAQEEGLNIRLENGNIYFNIGGLTANGAIAKDNLFHHYTFFHKNSSGEVRIYQDDKEIGASTGNTNVQFSNNNALVIGGNSFVGNMHDLRLWNKTISLDDAYAKMYAKLLGNEANLIGYWPMDEGRGTLANDKARYKHAVVNAAWDIKPKGTSYEFSNGQNLALDNVGYVQLTKEMDATISFWMKTGVSQEATLFSNGKGDGSDIIQTNGFANKWAINMNSSGNLTLASEGNSYVLTSQNMADNTWHHVTLLFNRLGSLKTYVDAAPVSSNLMASIRGFSGNKIWLGARGTKDLAGVETVDRSFTGKIDEFQLWNTLRNVEQISRDRFNEVNVESIGLLLYTRMNEPDPITANGPRYYHADTNQSVISNNAIVSKGLVNYSKDVPAIKPERSLIKFLVNHIINQDAMILEPVITDWASLEGQIVDVTVHRMFDSANNMQQSPITWTAYVKRNEVSWFAEGYNEIVDIVKKSGEDKSFEITLLNKGGKGQPFTITNLPKWLHLSKTTGTIAPDSKIIITATIDKELTPGEYLENLYLQTDFGYDEKMLLKVRGLAQEPDWTINPTDYKYSMNIVGRLKIDGKFSEDAYDRIAAFSKGELRGIAKLVYNTSYHEYYAFLTVYSNSNLEDTIEFKIWDSSQDKIMEATINAKPSIAFEENGILGKLSLPIIFENSSLVEQKIVFNKGWTWVSMNVNDVNFSDINKLTKNLSLETSDRMLSNSPSHLETYFKDESTPSKSGWSGTISTNGGLTDSKMLKVFMTYEQPLIIKGIPVNMSNWSFPIKTNWNWLPYSLAGNQLTNEALAYFDATDGDVIKSQNLFAVYDPIVGWNGTLNYLESGKGYMIKSSKAQTFKYPSYLSKTGKTKNDKDYKSLADVSQETIRPEFKQYSDNMNAIVLLPKGYSELFVYNSNGILKGVTVNQFVNNQELSFITVYGETPETLVFYIGDGINKKKTSKNFSFKSNDVLGTIAKPIIIEDIVDKVTIYPNPFDNEITIKVNAIQDQIVTIQLYSLTSQLLFTKKLNVTSGENVLKIIPIVASGPYLLQTEINGETIINKVIKN